MTYKRVCDMSLAEAFQLKYCPFCGSDLEQLQNRKDDDMEFITCTQCGSTGPKRIGLHLAAKAWNKRITVQE